MPSVSTVVFLFLCLCSALGAQTETQLKTRNVVLVVSDGLRWQEIFTGAERDLLTTNHGGNWVPRDHLKQEFWQNSPEARRKAVFPFLWSYIVANGQIYGNQTKGSVVCVTNGLDFSYPGYNEMLTGIADPKINSNHFGPNPNITVFEWLNNQAEFHDKVSIFGTWSIFKDIFNQSRSHLPLHVGWDLPYAGKPLTESQELLNDLYRTTTKLSDDAVYDSFLQVALLAYVKANHPRLLFVGYGETDNWAHSGRYDLVLESARGFDHFVEQLWTTIQSMPEYRDQTTLILTTDHGRGSGPEEWKDHGKEQKGSENIWIAVIGPDTRALGERRNTAPVTLSQIPATLAILLSKDYRKAVPAASLPISDMFH